MALKAVHASDVPNLHQVPESAVIELSSPRLSRGPDVVKESFKSPKFVVIGHRGNGMNMLYSTDRRMKAIKENSIRSFDAAGKHGVDFVEFDVQVTRDDCPIIFHDNFILTEEGDSISEKRITELSLQEFLCYGPQKEPGNVGKSLFRKVKDGRIFSWNVEDDDSLCTLEEAFRRVDPSLGFNIELKFDDNIVYAEETLLHTLQVILQAEQQFIWMCGLSDHNSDWPFISANLSYDPFHKTDCFSLRGLVVFQHAKERPIIFSSFQPDAIQLVRKLQSVYPVYFLTNGGSEVYSDVRRNSLDEAIKLCLEGGLQGIVSEVRAIFRNPGAIPRIKEAKLALLTYGQLNNVSEAVYMQYLMGVDGVIVDLVKDITEAISYFMKPDEAGQGKVHALEGEGQIAPVARPKFSQHELSFLLKLIPELVQF